MPFHRPSHGVAVLASILVAACAVGPDYKRPEIDAPVPVTAVRTLDHQRQLTRWWRRFGDPKLDAMIERAASDNLDIRTAVARLAEANARLGLAEAERRPTVNAQADAVRERTPGTVLPFNPSGAGGNAATTLSVTGLLSWEIDLWGRLARGRETALAELEQNRFGVEAMRLSIVTEVTSTYFALRAAEQQLHITERTQEALRHALELEQIRFDAGEAGELAVLQAEAQFETTSAQLPARRARVQQFEGVLAVLVGMSPNALMSEFDFGKGSIEDISVPVLDMDDLPASLIERRPDIRAAEAALMAATARIGIAEAMRLPSLSLGAMLGSIARNESDLFSSGAGAWSAGASLFGPVLDFGRSRARVDIAQAQREQAELHWRASVQMAFNEVRGARITFDAAAETIAATARQVGVIARTEALAEIRYQEGLISFIELLDARRTLLDAELALSEARRGQLTAAATLFKALGGGW